MRITDSDFWYWLAVYSFILAIISMASMVWFTDPCMIKYICSIPWQGWISILVTIVSSILVLVFTNKIK
jgi:uncharacterized membrane protein YhaH (DUF805 family)